jgi:hypothetical protein
LEFAASISSEHEEVQRIERSKAANATDDRRLLEWVATISPRQESELRSLLAAEAEERESRYRLEMFLESLDLQEAQWDPAKHPRLAGPPNAGWFATTGGTTSGGKPPSTIQLTGLGPTGASSKSVAYRRTAAAPKATRYNTTQQQTSTPRSKVPTAPASYSGPKQVVAQQVSVRKGIGHHWAPKAVVFDSEILPLLTDETAAYAMGSYSGPTDPAHNYGTIGGVRHRDYNQIVKDQLKKFIDHRKIKKMTPEQMEEFIDLINNGLDAFGEPHPQIAAFNNAIRKALPKGTSVPKKMEDIIAAGRKYMKHPRFKLLVAGAVISGLLGDVVAQQADVLDVASKSGHYGRAMQALQDGDLARAHALLVGDRDSLYMEILARVGAHAALNFKAAMDKVFESARDRD